MTVTSELLEKEFIKILSDFLKLGSNRRFIKFTRSGTQVDYEVSEDFNEIYRISNENKIKVGISDIVKDYKCIRVMR